MEFIFSSLKKKTFSEVGCKNSYQIFNSAKINKKFFFKYLVSERTESEILKSKGTLDSQRCFRKAKQSTKKQENIVGNKEKKTTVLCYTHPLIWQ